MIGDFVFSLVFAFVSSFCLGLLVFSGVSL
jgi:hypothetical protein